MGRMVRVVVIGFSGGALLAASALAGVVIDPLGISSDGTQTAEGVEAPVVEGTETDSEHQDGVTAQPVGAGDEELDRDDIARVVDQIITAPEGDPLNGGRFLVGAARATLAPDPDLWQTEGCTDLDADPDEFNVNGDHVVPSLEDMHGWPAASPDCVYLGGFGLGPVRPAERVGHGGVWVRAIAISNGADTHVYAIADTVGWFARYDTDVCPSNDCGILDVRERVAGDTGLDIGDVIIGSTHTHAGADTYGGWGGIPTWYREHLRDAAIAASKQAIANLQPARIRVGEVELRNRNNERRDTYYSTADTEATWLQAVNGDDVVATWATYAGHPTIVSDEILHADWPGATAREFERRYGGVGILFEGGLGNVSVSGLGGTSDEERAENTGIAIATAIAERIDGPQPQHQRLTSNDMQAATQVVTHPVATNPGLTGLALAGLFDREFTPGTPGAGLPGVYHWSREGEASTDSGEDTDPEFDPVFLNGCSSAGPTIITAAGAHRIGEFTVAFGPGEIFSNLAEVVKERADNSAVTMVLGQTNDALGYIIQSFEYDAAANAATHYGAQTNEYEEVFAVDRCFGDHVLETMLESTAAVGTGR